jgi:hypothetical protein
VSKNLCFPSNAKNQLKKEEVKQEKVAIVNPLKINTDFDQKPKEKSSRNKSPPIASPKQQQSKEWATELRT